MLYSGAEIDLIKNIKNYLDSHKEEAFEIGNKINNKKECPEEIRAHFDRYDFSMLCSRAAEKGTLAVGDLVRAAVNGNTYGGWVKYNINKNLIPASDEDLMKTIEECTESIACYIYDNYVHLDKMSIIGGEEFISDNIRDIIINYFDSLKTLDINIMGIEVEELIDDLIKTFYKYENSKDFKEKVYLTLSNYE